MREFSVPQSFSIPENVSMADSVFRHAEEDPTFVPFKRPSNVDGSTSLQLNSRSRSPQLPRA